MTALSMTQPVNRMKGSLPKIGIRPTIDGRYGGVRESLEDQVMAMANSTDELFRTELRYVCCIYCKFVYEMITV